MHHAGMNAEGHARALGQLHEVTVSVTKNLTKNNFRYRCWFQNHSKTQQNSSAKSPDAAWQAIYDFIERKIARTAQDGPSTVVQANIKAVARRARAAAPATTAAVTAAPPTTAAGYCPTGRKRMSENAIADGFTTQLRSLEPVAKVRVLKRAATASGVKVGLTALDQAAVGMAASLKTAMAPVNLRSRTNEERFCFNTWLLGVAGAIDTSAERALKAKLLGVRSRALMRGEAMRKEFLNTPNRGVPFKLHKQCQHLRKERQHVIDIWHSDACSRVASADHNHVVNAVRQVGAADGAGGYCLVPSCESGKNVVFKHVRRVMVGSRKECHDNYLLECIKREVPVTDRVGITTLFDNKCPCVKAAKVSDCVCKHCDQLERLLRRWGAASIADKCGSGCKCQDKSSILYKAALIAHGGSIMAFYATILQCPKEDLLGKEFHPIGCMEGNTCTCIAQFVTEFVSCKANKANTDFVWLQYGTVRKCSWDFQCVMPSNFSGKETTRADFTRFFLSHLESFGTHYWTQGWQSFAKAVIPQQLRRRAAWQGRM